MKRVELLSPAGDFDCLVSAVQNGADAVYFGADQFNARANSKNFSLEELEKAINYAKLRGVKTHLTLNIIIKNDEFEDALNLVDFAYKAGIDAIIVQDIGLASKIHEFYPDLELHSSTQMTNYNLSGVNKMQDIGFKRVVLARELNFESINEITKNTDMDIEVFIHGALCISYSGQCLMSSMIGGRSGNRGKCAGSCRLPYELINKDTNSTLEKGYLLSSKDVCSLDILPKLIEAGVTSFKIEGRMKSKEYVACVTSIYRKYIDLYYSKEEYKVDPKDRETLEQIFNRGGFSTGFLNGKLGKEMMYINRPNHLGIFVGKVISYNPNKGYVKFKTLKPIDMGDCIAIGDSTCKISELMINNQNIKKANVNDNITIGRIKGKINVGDSIYKTVAVQIEKDLVQTLRKENIKRKIDFNLYLEEGKVCLEALDKASSIKEKVSLEIDNSFTNYLEKQRAVEQLNKTGNTVFEVENINLYDTNIPLQISKLNELRRTVLENLEQKLISSFKKESKERKINLEASKKEEKEVSVSILLNNIDIENDYSFLNNVNRVYLPIKLFNDKLLISKLKQLINDFDCYLYLPAITNNRYNKFIEEISKEYDFKGFVISNLSQLNFVDTNKELIANYNLNIANNYSARKLKDYNFSKYTISPELEKETISNLENKEIEKEVIVYGRSLLMNTEYCVIGSYKNCDRKCKQGKFVLKDRLGFEFPVYTDTFNCNNYIYNSKITSIEWKDLNTNNIRIDILEETEDEIIKIIETHKKSNRLEGQDYTNGNLNREI